MGNTSTKNISLSIDQAGQALVAGSTVTGMVRVHVPTDDRSRGTIMQKTNLLFIGKEDVCVRYTVTTGSGDNQRTETRYSYSQRDIVRMAIPLEYPSDMSNGGNFEFPFQFQLPDQLPSSFEHASGGSWCKIRYKVKLDIKHAKDKEILVRVIAQPPSSQPVPNLVEPVSTNITLCCCIPKGEIIVAANVDDTRVGQGEEMKVDLGVKNNSTAALEFVSATIKQNISWTSSGHREASKTHLVRSQFNLNQDNMRARSKNEMQEMKNAATMAGNADRSRGIDLSDDTFREILAAVKDGSNKVVLQIPYSAFNTYHGSLITVQHHLNIKAKTPFGSTNPTIRVPLQIVSPESVASPAHSHPEPTAPDFLPTPSAPPMNPEGWNAENVTSVAPSAPSLHSSISYGGNVVDSEQEIAFEGFDLPPIGGGSPSYDYPSLLKEIQSSLSIRTKLQDLLKNDEWKAVIVELMPNQFTEILDKVTLEFDKADVIEVLAGVVKNFNCAYAAFVLRKVPDWLRIQTVQKMIPFCIDLKTNKSVLVNELSDWERISTERDFENAINK